MNKDKKILGNYKLFRTFVLALIERFAPLQGPDGGIGRHAGLKILWPVMAVPVRSRLRVHEERSSNQRTSLFYFVCELTALLYGHCRWLLTEASFVTANNNARPPVFVRTQNITVLLTLKGGCADRTCLLLDLRSALLGIRARSQATFDPAPVAPRKSMRSLLGIAKRVPCYARKKAWR